MNDRVRFYIRAGRFLTPGRDYGPKGMQLIWRNDPYMIVKYGAYMMWGGIGMPRSYVPITYQLVKTGKDEEGDSFFEVVKEARPEKAYGGLLKEWKEQIKIAIAVNLEITKNERVHSSGN